MDDDNGPFGEESQRALERVRGQIIPILARQRELEDAKRSERLDELRRFRLDLNELMRNPQPAKWLVEPLIMGGSYTVIHAPPGAGKSLLTLEIAAALATGRRVLGSAVERSRVLYIDQENDRHMIAERLADLGYEWTDDLSWLIYVSLSDIAPLNTQEGLSDLRLILDEWNPQLVIIDTMARVVEGEENSADTYRSFYRMAGAEIKRRDIALLALDHTGKDLTAGPRGSSGKVDAADAVFTMTVAPQPNGSSAVTLKAIKRRLGEIPEITQLIRDDSGVLCHRPSDNTWPAGTKECADALDALGVDVTTGRIVASRVLAAGGFRFRTSVVSKALIWRRTRCEIEGMDRPEKASKPVPKNREQVGTGSEKGENDGIYQEF
ncbi:MAG: AAA family ATPase [Ferrimicrobium sp.]